MMKRFRLDGVLVVAALALLWLSAASLEAAGPGQGVINVDYVAGEVLVGLKPGISGIQSAHRQTGAVVVQTLAGPTPIQRVRLPRTTSVPQALVLYRADPRVRFA